MPRPSKVEREKSFLTDLFGKEPNYVTEEKTSTMIEYKGLVYQVDVIELPSEKQRHWQQMKRERGVG